MSKFGNVIERRGRKFKLILYRGTYAAKFHDQCGKRIRRSLSTKDESEAHRRLTEFAEDFAEAMDQQDVEAFRDATVADLWPLFAENLRERAIAIQLPYVWKAIQSSFGHLRARSIRREDCQLHIEARRKFGRKDGTIHSELGVLQMMLNWAFQEKLIPNASRIYRPPKPPSCARHLNEQQVKRLLEEAKSPHILLFIQLAITTAARKTALLELTWDRVNFDENYIDLTNPDDTVRRKKRARVPMGFETKQILAMAHKAALTDHVIEYCGKPVNDVKKALKRVGCRSRIPWFSAHVLRHTAAVQMAKAGVPMLMVSQYLGHSNSRITEETYARFSPDFMSDANNVLEGLMPCSIKPE